MERQHCKIWNIVLSVSLIISVFTILSLNPITFPKEENSQLTSENDAIPGRAINDEIPPTQPKAPAQTAPLGSAPVTPPVVQAPTVTPTAPLMTREECIAIMTGWRPQDIDSCDRL